MKKSGLAPPISHRKSKSLLSGQDYSSPHFEQLSLLRSSKSSDGFLFSCPGLGNSHIEFVGTIGELRSRAGSGCKACSIIYDGVVALEAACFKSTNCEVSWKPRGKGTLTVLVRHKCEAKYLPEKLSWVEFFHDLGPFGMPVCFYDK
jgi:hypothetical protein